jgi:hypothetical protein
MIALSSAMLTRALFPSLHPVVTAASLASTPFKPFLVTTGNALALEGKFLQRGLQNPGGCSVCVAVCLPPSIFNFWQRYLIVKRVVHCR